LHLYKESQSLDIVRALVQGDNTVQTTVRAKVQHEQGWTRKSAISVRAAEIAETVLSSKEPVIGDAAVVEPLLAIHDTELQDPQPPQSPLHAQPVPKVSAIRKEVRRVFCEEDGAWVARVHGYTMQGNLFALLQAESEGITWKSYMWNHPRGVLKFSLNASIDTLPTFTNLKRWGKHASVNCHLCGNTVKQTLFHVLVHCNQGTREG
jgi:hypothetical protein